MNVRVAITIFLTGLMVVSPVSGYEDTPSCFRRLETGFFSSRLVTQALSMHNVYQSQWTPILQALKQNVQEVPKIVRVRAKKMSPNPLQNPFNPKEAQKLLMDVLYEVFNMTLRNNDLVGSGVLNQDDIDKMFQYIWSNQIRELEACFITPYIHEKEQRVLDEQMEKEENTVIDEEEGKPVEEENIVVPKKTFN